MLRNHNCGRTRSGAGSGPRLLTIMHGECKDPQPAGTITWGKVRALYR